MKSRTNIAAAAALIAAAGACAAAAAPASAHDVTICPNGDTPVVHADHFPAGAIVQVKLGAGEATPYTIPNSGTLDIPIPSGQEVWVGWTADGGGKAWRAALPCGQTDIAPPSAPPAPPAAPPSAAPPAEPQPPAPAPGPPAPGCVPIHAAIRIIAPRVLPRQGRVTLRARTHGKVRGIVWRHRSVGEHAWRVIGHGRTITVDTRLIATRTSTGGRRKGWQVLRVTGRSTSCSRVRQVRATARRYSLDP